MIQTLNIRLDCAWKCVDRTLIHNPLLYKTIVTVSHIARAFMMSAVMILSPIIALSVILPFSLIYAVCIERKSCAFKFTLPSIVGAACFFLTYITPFGAIPLTAYTITVCYLSHRDVNAQLARNCCH